jgi:hypothetical protein
MFGTLLAALVRTIHGSKKRPGHYLAGAFLG